MLGRQIHLLFRKGGSEVNEVRKEDGEGKKERKKIRKKERGTEKERRKDKGRILE